jgi:hypothetical protein
MLWQKLTPWRARPRTAPGQLLSCLCTEAQMRSAPFVNWVRRMEPDYLSPDGTSPRLHRKLWEWCIVAQALHERALLRLGRRCLGSAVGTEPLPACFAGLGCTVVVTDQPADRATRGGWVAANGHASQLAKLYLKHLCAEELLGQRVASGRPT